MKKKIISLLLAITMITGTGIGVNRCTKDTKIRNVEELLQNNEAKHLFIDKWYSALEMSNFSQREKEILDREFLPYLLENFDMYNSESLANLLSATENTSVNYVSNYSTDTREASYNNVLCKLPFIASFTDGTITLDENYTNEQFLHEYYHCTQGWKHQDYIYAEAYANFGSNGNYDDLYAIFTILGDLGDKEFLFKNLINGTMDDYWNYLYNIYVDDKEIVRELRIEIENVYTCTYKSNAALRYESFQKEIRNNVLEKIKYLYSKKYNNEIINDNLFQVLMSMYNLDDRYCGVNNPLLEGKLVFTYNDGESTYTYVIDDANRFSDNNSYSKHLGN